jgi:hypothetical protein
MEKSMTTWKIGENNGQTNETHGQIEKIIKESRAKTKAKSQKPRSRHTKISMFPAKRLSKLNYHPQSNAWSSLAFHPFQGPMIVNDLKNVMCRHK